MEARIARLESDVGHIRSDLAEVKADVRSVRDKMDLMGIRLSEGVRLDDKIDKLTARNDEVKDSITAAKTQALVLYIALAGGMFGTMARGFGWI